MLVSFSSRANRPALPPHPPTPPEVGIDIIVVEGVSRLPPLVDAVSDVALFEDVGRVGSILLPVRAPRLGERPSRERVQALRFDAKRWTVKQAQAWLQAHDFRTDIEPATATRAHASDRAHVRDLRERLRARIEQAKRIERIHA